MNTVKKVLSRHSHSGSDRSSDEGHDRRLSTSTAPTSNPGSPQNHTKDISGHKTAGVLPTHNSTTTTTGNNATGLGIAGTGAGATAATTGHKQTTGEKITNKIEHGLGRSADVHAKDGTIRHTFGHESSPTHLDLTKGDVDQDVQHLAHVTRHTHQRHEVEEVTREKEHHRHIHHVQHHTQPVLETEHAAEKVHAKVHPVTKVHETHASTDKDAALLTSVAGTHKDSYAEAPLHRQVVDKGELVKEHIHHHIHNVVQPIVEKDTHEYHRIQTVIPTHVVTHEAPIVHESTHHKPVSKADFLSNGGKLGNTITSVHEANLLNTGKCDRKVDGIAEKLERELGLKSSTKATAAI